MNEMCVWANDEWDESSMWETSCGHFFVFENGGPKENKQKFCGYCGKELEEIVRTHDDEGTNHGKQ